MKRKFFTGSTILLTGLAVLVAIASELGINVTQPDAPMQQGVLADEVPMPDFGPTGNGSGLCSSNAGIPAIRLANGGVTVYFNKSDGRLLQITNASAEPFTFGGIGGCDNTGLFQDWEPKNTNWSGCSKAPGRVSPPIDFCSFTAYLTGALNPAVQPNPTYEITGDGEPHLHVSNVSAFEGPSPSVWGNPDYDPQPAGKWIFDIDYFIKASGVINVQFKVSDTNATESLAPWISFPFVLVSPYDRSDAYVFETGPEGSRDITHGDFFSSLGVKDTYIFNDPTIVGLNANVSDNRYSPLWHNSIDLPASSMCPPGRYKESHGPYSTLTGLYPGEFTTLGSYFGVHMSDMSRGLVAQVPSNASQIVLYQDGEPNGLAEAFVATKLPIGRTDLGENYSGSIYFMPWGGGAGGVDLPTAKRLLNGFSSSIDSPSSEPCACLTDVGGTSDPPQNIQLTVNSNSAANFSTAGSSPTLNTGYIVVGPNGNVTPFGATVFTVRQNGATVSEASVPTAAPTTAARVFVRIGGAAGNTNTGVAIVNPTSSPVGLSFTLRNTEGAKVTSGNATLAPGEHIARFISELSVIAPDFLLPPTVESSGAAAVLDVSSAVPVSVMALDVTENERGETLLANTTVVDLTQAPSSSVVSFPQFVDGGGYTTTIVLINNDVEAQTGQLSFWNVDGSDATVSLLGYAPSHSFAYTIPVGGVRVFQSSGQDAALSVEWAAAIPDVFGTSPAGSGIFQTTSNGIVVSQTGFPGIPPLRQLTTILDLSAGRNLGLTLSNIDDTPLPLQITLTNSDGSDFASLNLTLAGRSQAARFITELFSIVPVGFIGELHIVVTEPTAPGVAAITLRSLINERGEFLINAFPLFDPTQPAPSPVIFPQFVDGGDYASEVVLMSPGQGILSSSLHFFSDLGRWFPVSP